MLKNKLRILLLDELWQPSIEKLGSYANIDVKLGISEKKLIDIIKYYNAVILKSGTTLNKSVLTNASNLKLIIRAGSSLDNIDLIECKNKNIKVISTHESITIAVAEFTVAIILSICRKLPILYNVVQKRDFRRSLYVGKELQNLVVGIVGLGKIGLRTSQLLKHFGCTLIGYSKHFTNLKQFESLGGMAENDLNTLLSKSDIVSLHLPLTKETEFIINEEKLCNFKRGSILINTARGKLIKDSELVKALDKDILSFAVLDTLYPDCPFHDNPANCNYDHPLLHHPNIFVTPHSAASTEQSLQQVSNEVVNTIVNFFGGNHANIV
jgi:D-3-phosphoglycerate dehydrogenase